MKDDPSKQYSRMVLTLTKDERDALVQLAQSEQRYPDQQLRHLLQVEIRSRSAATGVEAVSDTKFITERRWGVRVPVARLIPLLMTGAAYTCIEGIPTDAVFLGAHYDHATEMIIIKIASPSLDRSPIGATVPFLPLPTIEPVEIDDKEVILPLA